MRLDDLQKLQHDLDALLGSQGAVVLDFGLLGLFVAVEYPRYRLHGSILQGPMNPNPPRGTY